MKHLFLWQCGNFNQTSSFDLHDQCINLLMQTGQLGLEVRLRILMPEVRGANPDASSIFKLLVDRNLSWFVNSSTPAES